MLEEKVFSGTSLHALSGVIYFLHVTRLYFTESLNMIWDCDQTLSPWAAQGEGDSFSGDCGKSKPHSVALHRLFPFASQDMGTYWTPAFFMMMRPRQWEKS